MLEAKPEVSSLHSTGLAQANCRQAHVTGSCLQAQGLTDADGAVLRRSKSRGCGSHGVAVWSAVLALGLLARSASAHHVWADGSQIPVWVKSACCGKDEAHLLRPNQVHKVEGGYRIDGYPLIVPDTSALPSQDGNYWAFYQIYGIVGDRPQVSNIRCFFVPLGV